MADKSRHFSIYLLVLSLIGAALFYGCAGEIISDAVPGIEYCIAGKFSSKAFTTSPSTRAAAGPSTGILIYSELDPLNFADIDTASNTFIIKNLKPGRHYLVFKYMPAGTLGDVYITRSESPVVITPENPVRQSQDLKADKKAEKIITGKILDTNGSPVFPAPKLTLWGQTIDVQSDGTFVTPPMPDGVTADLIIQANNYQQTATPVTFRDNPTTYEITAVGTSVNNQPPIVDLTSKNSEYKVKSVVTLTAKANDPNNDELVYKWEIASCTSAPNMGSLELYKESAKESTYYWIAPDTDCMATISVKVYEKETPYKLSAKAELPIKIGTGIYIKNTVPEITSTDIPKTLKGNRTYKITVNATDEDGDPLYYFLTITRTSETGSTGTCTKYKDNVWKWKTPELTATSTFDLHFKVQDKKKNTASLTKRVEVGKTEPNEPPVIESFEPTASSVVVKSGVETIFSVKAKDPENASLDFAWSCDDGEIVSSLDESNESSATWMPPYVNAPITTEVRVRVSDQEDLSTVVRFTVTVNPDPDKKAPTIDIKPLETFIKYYNATYTTDIPLLKAGESITFSGSATDNNRNELIPFVYYNWSVQDPMGITSQMGNSTKTVVYKATDKSLRGDYIVTMTSKDLDGKITGSNKTYFSVNTLPITGIRCDNGYLVNPETGRRGDTAPTIYTYEEGTVKYDVYQGSDYYSKNFVLTADVYDKETDASTLEASAEWEVNGKKAAAIGKTLKLTYDQIVGSLTTVILTTMDSKGEKSDEARYSFFVNGAPKFEIASPSKETYIANDNIQLQVKVTDDYNGINLKWEFRTAATTDPTAWTDYNELNTTNFGYNPLSTSSSKELSSIVNIPAQTLIEKLFSEGTGNVEIKITANDSMGRSTEKLIKFNIEESHKVNNLNVASGSYNTALDQDFKTLTKLDPPYIFTANQKFSIQSNTNKWDDEKMVYTWYDVWLDDNNNAKSTKAITDPALVNRGNLNGYRIDDQFGTHTIRLEATRDGITASQSVTVFVNSVPTIKFVDAKEGGIMRFDTGDDSASLKITVTEDNPNERLGIEWTFIPLIDDPSAPDGFKEGTPLLPIFSHDLDSSTATSPFLMSGTKSTTTTVSGLIKNLASGAVRINARVYDAWNASSTATVDVLINRLPEFKSLTGKPEVISVSVPAESDNPATEDYSQFTDQPYTHIGADPVFLTTQPTMFLKCEINAYDYELATVSLNLNQYTPEEHIIWTFDKGDAIRPEYSENNATSSTKSARFGIGKNTVRVELRDTFYYSYGGRFKDLASATCSMDFYVWESQSHDIYSFDNDKVATNIYKASPNDTFYVQFGRNTEYVEKFQILGMNKNLNGPVVPGKVLADQHLYTCKRNDDGTLVYEIATYTLISQITTAPANPTGNPIKVLTLLPSQNGDFIMLTDSKTITKGAGLEGNTYTIDPDDLSYDTTATPGNKGGLYVGYKRRPNLDADVFSTTLCNNLMIKISGREKNSDNELIDGASIGANPTYGYPGNDSDYMNKVISMTSTDNEMGAMLIKDWSSSDGAKNIVAPFNTQLYTYPNGGGNFNPLNTLDGLELKFTDDSKIRYLNKLENISSRLFITDTGNHRIIRTNSSYSEATSIDIKYPIDIAETNSKYLFTLTGYDGTATAAINLLKLTNSSYSKVCEPFGKLIEPADVPTEDTKKIVYRAGKFLNPKAMYFYTTKSGDNVFGGLVVLEDGSGLARDPNKAKSRVQIIRTGMMDWIE